MSKLPTAASAGLPPATVSEDQYLRYLHLGSDWIQGAMQLRDPDMIALEYVQQMMMWLLFMPAPRHIVQLGLGSAALTKFCYRHLPAARVTAIELNPAVIDTCRAQFALPPDDARLSVRQADAFAFVSDPANHGSVDVLQVDLYDHEARGPVFDSDAFYRACAACLTPQGIMTMNLFGEGPCYARNLNAMQPAFDALAWLTSSEDRNVVIIAFREAPVIDFNALYRRASAIKRELQLPATQWVDGLKAWMRESAG